MGERLLEIAVLIAGQTREKVKALFGAGGGDVGERVEVLEALGERGGVLDGAGVLELLQLVQEDLGVLEVGRVPDARWAAEGEPDAFDAVAQGAAAAVGDRGGEDAREALEEEIVLDQLPDGRVAAGAGNVVELLK